MNIKDVLILKEVIQDLNNGKKFYDRIHKGVGGYFWDSLVADIESLIIFGGTHLEKQGLYRMLAKRFPYAIYYEVENEIVRVIAVLPMRRDPTWIEKTIGDRN
jgi:hypothetical protein